MRSAVHGPDWATEVRFSSTVSDLKMLRSCGTQPMPACARWSGRSAVMSRPSSAMLPEMKRVTPTIELISVVLPMPLRPSKASDCRSASASDTALSTTASPYPAVSRSMARSSGIERLPEIDRLDARIARDLLGRAVDEQGTVDQHRDAVGEREYDVHVVLDQEHRHVGRQRRDRRQDLVALVLGHAGGRLVEQQHARAAGDGERNLDQALLAVGQIAGAFVHHVGEVEAGKDLDDLLDHRRARADQ